MNENVDDFSTKLFAIYFSFVTFHREQNRQQTSHFCASIRAIPIRARSKLIEKSFESTGAQSSRIWLGDERIMCENSWNVSTHANADRWKCLLLSFIAAKAFISFMCVCLLLCGKWNNIDLRSVPHNNMFSLQRSFGAGRFKHRFTIFCSSIETIWCLFRLKTP